MNLDQTNGYMGKGFLIVHVTTARGAIPLEGAQVNIRNSLPQSDNTRGDVLYSITTNRDGNTEKITLPAPPRADSLSPTQNDLPPFATYHIDVYQEGFFGQTYLNIPIFDGITAIQPADMIPLPENGRTDSRTPDGEQFFESTAPNL